MFPARSSSVWELLQALLDGVLVRSTVQCAASLRGEWALEFTGNDAWVFHVVRGRGCSLVLDGGDTRELRDRNVVLIGNSRGHRVGSRPQAVPLWRGPISEDGAQQCNHLGTGGEGATRLICGGFRFEDPDHPFLRRLPPVIVVTAEESASDSLLACIDLLATETDARRPGCELVMQRLADAVFINIVRSWIASEPDPLPERGWIAAAGHEGLAAALVAVHDDLGYPWTLASLARVAGMSRSSFVAKFTQTVGCPPGQYLTEVRMRRAAVRLRGGSLQVAGVAPSLGYRSEAAFSRAFKRVIGVPPGAISRGAAGAAPAAGHDAARAVPPVS